MKYFALLMLGLSVAHAEIPALHQQGDFLKWQPNDDYMQVEDAWTHKKICSGRGLYKCPVSDGTYKVINMDTGDKQTIEFVGQTQVEVPAIVQPVAQAPIPSSMQIMLEKEVCSNAKICSAFCPIGYTAMTGNCWAQYGNEPSVLARNETFSGEVEKHTCSVRQDGSVVVAQVTCYK